MFKIYKILGNVRGLAFKQQFNKSQVAIPYVNSLFEHWKKDNSSVGEGWNEYFSKVNILYQKQSKVEEKNEHCLTLNNPLMELKIDIIFKSFNMFREFYASGHMLANIDPLCIIYFVIQYQNLRILKSLENVRSMMLNLI